MFVCVCVNLLLLVFALFSVLGSTPFHQSHTGFSQHGLSDFPRPVCVCSKLQCCGLPTKSEFTNPDNGYNKVPRLQILCNCFLQVGDQPSTFKLTLSCPQRSGYKAAKLVDTPTHATLMDVTGLGGPIKMDFYCIFHHRNGWQKRDRVMRILTKQHDV